MERLIVPVNEMTPEIYMGWDELIKNQECAVCGSRLTEYTVPPPEGSPKGTIGSLAVGCVADHSHVGFKQATSYTQDYRRGQPIHPVIQGAIERHMLTEGTDLNRAINLLALRFPQSIKDRGGAALFIHDCIRLGLDPLIQPAEAVPVPFKTRDKAGNEKWTVAMITTEDGALSMVARGCPEEYDGAPATMPLLDHLIKENPTRPLVELEALAARTAGDICGDAQAWVWVALGKRRSAVTVNPVYGYFTQAEYNKAKSDKVPAAKAPGNQARVRAVKRWARETFPEARQRMLDYYAEVSRRSGGALEVQQIVDAEYRILPDPTRPQAALPGPAGASSPNNAHTHTPKAAHTQRTQQADNKVGEPAERSTAKAAGAAGRAGSGQGGAANPPAAPSGAGEHTLLSTGQAPKMADPREAPAGRAGFINDLIWVYETMGLIHWSDKTATSWIKSAWPTVDVSGKLSEILARLDKEQAGHFTRYIQKEADKAQSQRNLL